MPLLWRYLLKSYFKVFLLSVTGFVSILLVTRLKEIARFSALSSNPFSVILYTFYQIPHILPIAIPISCLISSLLLFQKLSRTQELTAIRASGISLKEIIAPLFISATLLSILNFIICSEVTSKCRYKSKEIIYNQSTKNPISLLQRQSLIRLKNCYIDMKSSSDEKTAKNLFLIIKNKANSRLNLIYAHKLQFDRDLLIGNNVSIISHLKADKEDFFDNLIIENQSEMVTKANALSKILKPSRWSLNSNFLNFRMLLVKGKHDKLKTTTTKKKEKIYVEIARRFSLAFSAFSFTFIGICFGMEISRTKSKKGLIFAAFLSLLILITFIVAKALKYYSLYATLMYILPQPLILIYAFKKLKKISGGRE